MSGSLRQVAVVYAACVLVLVLAMGFVTRRVLELEHLERDTRAQARLREQVRLALWRIDSTMTGLLARESARPILHYRAFYSPQRPDATTEKDLLALSDPQQPLIASPLLTSPDPVVRLYFERDGYGELTSPQVPTGGHWALALLGDIDFARLDAARQSLTQLEQAARDSELLASSAPEADGIAPSSATDAASTQAASVGQTSPGDATSSAQQVDFTRRQEAVSLALRREQSAEGPGAGPASPGTSPATGPPATASPSVSSDTTTSAPAPSEVGRAGMPSARAAAGEAMTMRESASDTRRVGVSSESGQSLGPPGARGQGPPRAMGEPIFPQLAATVGESAFVVPAAVKEPVGAVVVCALVPRSPATGASPEFFVLRSFDRSGERIVQGLWFNWSTLKAQLEASIQDLLPGAALLAIPNAQAGEIFRGDPVMNVSLRAPPISPETLASLPARLIIPESVVRTLRPAASDVFSATRVAIYAGWVAVLVTATAIGLLLLASVRLGERRGRFVSAITHELRTPLTTFRLYSEMLADGMVKDPAAQREYHITLRNESQRLSRIVESVLDYAKLGANARLKSGIAGAPRLDASRKRPGVGIDDLLTHVLTPAEARARAAGLELVVVREPDSLRGRLLVHADPALVERIIQNLVDNACKYASPGEREAAQTPGPGGQASRSAPGRIELRVGASRSRVRLSVRDQGPGVPEGERRNIFKPFHRGRAHEGTTTPGLGLGLAFARSLARDAGGDLRLEPQDPARPGACFTLELLASWE
ncbi:MAG: ATP-binding protein [Planctomycetota bacterium]|nr:ATP-binding protein [Planctomycetota bacterium]